jgi:hypothetical protein
LSEPASQQRDVDLFVPFADHIESAIGWRGLFTTPALIAGVVAVGAAFLRVVIGGQSTASLVAAIAIGALIVALVLVYVQLRKRNAGLFLAGHRVGAVDALGRRSGVDLAQVDHLHLCSVTGLNVSTPTPLLLIIGRNGRVAQRFYRPDALEAGGLEDLAKRGGIQLKGAWDETYSPDQLQKRFPGALPWIQTASIAVIEHPHRTAWIVGGITVGAFVVLAIVLLARSPQ